MKKIFSFLLLFYSAFSYGQSSHNDSLIMQNANIIYPSESPFQLSQRVGQGFTFPVVTFRPSATNANLALDLMPFGTGSNFGNNGITWFDVCNADLKFNGPNVVTTARVGIRTTAVEFGERVFNSSPAVPLYFTMKDGTAWGMEDTVGNWGFGRINGFTNAGSGRLNILDSAYSQLDLYYNSTHKSQVYTDPSTHLILKPDSITVYLTAPTATQASLNLPAGTAKTSPAQGDLYAITGHLYYRDQSTTYDLLASSGNVAAGSNTQIQYNNGGVFGASSAFTFTSATAAIADNLSQNASTNFIVTNSNTGTGANAEIEAYNGTYGTALLQFGSGTSSYGGWLANGAGIYTSSAHLNLMADNASGEIDFLTGSTPSVTAKITTGGLMTVASISTPKVLNTAAQSTVSGSVSGSAIFSEPEQGSSYKKVIVYSSALSGTAAYTFPVAFTNTPVVSFASSGITASTGPSTTAVTITGTATSGFLIIEGY